MMPRLTLVLCLLFAPIIALAEADSHREAAVELLQAMRSDQTVDQVYETMMPMFASMADNMDLSETERPIFERHMQRTMEALQEEMTWEKWEPHMVDIYVNVYSEEELRAITEFYLSPAGQALLDGMPLAMEETMRVTQQMMQDFMPRMQQLQAELLADLERSRGLDPNRPTRFE
ncbi:MAG: DUF2059 domain-containing protein [Woeseiaceae bacterium]|nr:DUF2059 domain-containing protein [Woeseiaceae bacterium]